MNRVRYTTTIQDELLRKTKVIARTNGYSGANDVLERALKLYFKMHGTSIWEKNLPDGKCQTVTIHDGHMSLDYVDKRISIDTVSDIEKLFSDGYQCVFEV